MQAELNRHAIGGGGDDGVGGGNGGGSRDDGQRGSGSNWGAQRRDLDPFQEEDNYAQVILVEPLLDTNSSS